jgi:hypothetical protein
MAKYLTLPDGSSFEMKEGQTPTEAMQVALQLYPDAFGFGADKPKQDTTGLKAAASAGLERLKGQTALTAAKLGFKDIAEAESYQKQQEAKAAARFTPTEQGWTEAPFLKFRETLGGSLPYMAAPAAAGLAALAAPISAPVAAGLGLVGAGAVSTGQFTGSNIARQMEEGKSLQEASLGKAAAAAVPQALIDTAAMALLPGVGKLFGSVGSKLTTEQAKAIASQTLAKTAADYTAKTGMAMGREGITEAAQQTLERLQAGLDIADPEARKEYIDSFIGGAVLGGAAAPVGRAFERSGAKRQAEAAQQQEQAEAAAAAEAAKNQPDALRQLDNDFRAAEQQRVALQQQFDATKPKKGTTEEQRAAHERIKAERTEFLNTTYKPLRQEYQKRKGVMDELFGAEQAALEAATAQDQQAAKLPLPSDIPGAQPFQLSDTSRLMNEYDNLRNQVGTLEQQLAAGPDLDTQTALTQQRSQLMARMNEMAPVIEERGGVTETEKEFTKKVNAAEKERLRLLETGDFDAAAEQAEVVRGLQARAPYLQELADFRTKAGQTRDLFTEAPAAPTTVVDEQLKQQTLEEEQQRLQYGKPTSVEEAAKQGRIAEDKELAGIKPITPMPDIKAQTGIKPEELAAVQTAQQSVTQAQTALDEAVKTKDTTKIFGAVDALNQAQNTVARTQEDVGRPLLKPTILDIFSPANLFKTAFENGDTKLLNDLASHSDTTALRTALDEKLSEREKLINVLENRAGLGGTDRAARVTFAPEEAGGKTRTVEKGKGEELQSVKRERADLFAKLYDDKQQALFKNGTYPDRELQALYDKGGPAAVEYERVMQDVEELSKKVTTKQGNAKKSLYEQLVDLAAQHAALVAQMESGVAAPTLREKTAGLQAKLGKGEAPAERQMDAKEKYDLQRRIDTLVNKYKLVEGQITPIRNEILKLHDSLYVTTPLEKVSTIAERKARESDEAARGPKAKTRATKTAGRINAGDVRKEAETSQKMRDLARDLGMEETEYKEFAENIAKRYANLKAKYGTNDPAVTAFQISMADQLSDKAMSLGKATPEYKATLKEQIEYFQKTLANVNVVAGAQTAPSKRTPQVTRKQSGAPKVLRVAGSRMTDKEIEKEISEGTAAEKKRNLRGVEVESLALNRDVVALLEKGDVQGALRNISQDPAVDKFSQAVAARLAPFLDITKVKVADKLTAPDGGEVLGAATSKLIELSRDGGLSVETLLHESTHAAAERVVQLAETNPAALTKEQKLAINELKALHARVKADAGITSENAKGSLSEFVAEVMSNRNLQKQLAQRKWRMSDMWNGIKSVIMRMLGFKNVETMFGASVVAVDQLFVPSSVRNLGGRTETKATRKLSAKDIAALDDGSNSMKQFAAQFGDRIKQKDRTPEDVERIGADVIDEMMTSVWGDPDQSVVAMPTADSLDYRKATIMSDGKPYDENNPLHYVEATPATFAALEALNNQRLRDREAETIRSQRRDDFKALGLYLQRNYENYTTAETALVLKAAAKYGVISGSNGRLKLVEIGKDNRHNVAVVGKETADAVIEQLRAGKGLKQAFLDGLQKNADANAKNNERKNGWKKFDQAESNTPLLTTLYTDEEVAEADARAVNDGLEFGPDTGHNNMDDVIEALVESGYLPFKGNANSDALEQAAIALNVGCAGTPWCTGGSVGTARNQISEGDFYVYYNKGRPEVAVRMDGNNKIGEVRGNNPNQALDPAQQQIAADFLRAKKFEKADAYLSEFARREALVKLAKGEKKLGVNDLLGDNAPLDTDGKVDDYAIGRLLKFRTIDGYGNRPKPVDGVVEFFGKQYLDAATRAYENNQFVFSNVSIDDSTTPVEVEFAGKKYKTLPTEIKALNRVSVNSYSYGPTPAAPVVLPKLAQLGSINFFRGELDLPALQKVGEVTFFNDTLSGNVVAKIKLPVDAQVDEVRGYGDKVSGTIEGPQTINLVTLTQGGGALTLDLPDTKYVVIADDAQGVARHFASEANTAIDDLLKADGFEFGDILRARRGEATPEQNAKYETVAKRELKKFFKALEDVFGYAAYEHALNNSETAEAYRDTFNYNRAIRYAVDDVLELNNYSREAFDKMAKVIKDATGAEVTYPKGQLIAPKRVGNPPYDQAVEETPEERRFAPKDVGVQKDKQGNFSFARKPSTSSSVVAREPGVVDNLLGNMLGLAGRVQFIDQYAALEAATKKGMNAGVVSSLEATNINYLLRFGQQRSQFAGQFLTNGPVKAEHVKKAGGVETIYRSTKGVSMLDVAKELNKAKLAGDVEQENMFTLYVAGKRANQVGWDKLNFSSPAQAKAEYDAVIARLNNNETAKKAFQEAAKLYQQYNAGLMDFLVDTGALSAKKAAELKALEYVPFYRVNNNGEVQLMIDKERPVRIANIKDQPQLKELVGGNTAILPIFTSSAQNTFMITGMGLRNQAVKETSFMLQKLGIASRVAPGNGPTGTNTVRFFKNGDPYYALIDTDAYGIPAELVVRGMEGIKTTLPAVIKLMGIPANILRSFVVRNPTYAARQIIRDPLNAWLTTGTDAVPVLSSMKELASMVAGRSDAEKKLMETGAISSNVYSGDEQDMTKFLKDISAGKSGWAKAVGMLDTFALQGDAATRAVIYKDSLAKGMTEQEALLRTLESMNFSRRGVSPSMQALSTLIPFFNAQVQGLDVIYRAFKGDMPFSQQLDIRGKMVRRGALIAASTVAYAMLMQDDEAYQRAKPEERLANWFVYIPGIDEPVRVPIPFEMGFLFKALPEAVYNMAMQDDKADAAIKGLGRLAAQTVPLSLPQAVKPLTEAVLGKSFYSGDIESSREKDVLATQRYRDNSTELAKTIGAVTGNVGLSPITIDYLIRGYTGGLGIALIQLANPLLAPDAKAGIAEPTTKISKTPFIGGLFQPVQGRGTLDEAYDRMQEIRQIKGTFNDMVEKGQRAEAMAFAQEYSDKLAAVSLSGSTQKRLGEFAKLERQIKAAPNLTTEQKDAQLERLDKAKQALAKQLMAVTAQR